MSTGEEQLKKILEKSATQSETEAQWQLKPAISWGIWIRSKETTFPNTFSG